LYPKKKREPCWTSECIQGKEGPEESVARERDGSASIPVYSREERGLYHTRVGKLPIYILNKAFLLG